MTTINIIDTEPSPQNFLSPAPEGEKIAVVSNLVAQKVEKPAEAETSEMIAMPRKKIDVKAMKAKKKKRAAAVRKKFGSPGCREEQDKYLADYATKALPQG